jgi:hypothetical protein
MSRIEQPPSRPHSCRLGACMLGGIIVFSVCCQPVVGNLQDEWYQAAPLIYPLAGAILGFIAELMYRFMNPES